MNFKNQQTDSGSYVNGIYTTKNGFAGSGLNCPRGTRLYDPNIIKPIFFEPEGTPDGEQFRKITQDVCPDIMPYYAVSNYGRVMNIHTGQVMKPNYRPNGYEYYCFAAENAKTNQKKYSTSRMVMMTFDPKPNMNKLQVNHKNGNKSENYYNKVMEDGSIKSNLEWLTPKENVRHSHITGLNNGSYNLSMDKARHIRRLKDQGYSYTKIQHDFYPNLSVIAIQGICKNKSYYDPNYLPMTNYTEFSYRNVDNNNFKVSDIDAMKIRQLAREGYKYKDIQKMYRNITLGTISQIVRGKTHNREV